MDRILPCAVPLAYPLVTWTPLFIGYECRTPARVDSPHLVPTEAHQQRQVGLTRNDLTLPAGHVGFVGGDMHGGGESLTVDP